MTGSREVELKLELPPGDTTRRLERTFNHLGGGTGFKHHLVSIYYDTGNRALRKQGLTLRVRSDGHRRVQTVKAIDTVSASTFDRLEWETEIEGERPDLDAAARTPVGDILNGKSALKMLVPVFQTVVDRTTWRIMHDGFEIEAALDEGRIVAGGSTRPIAELELELKRGLPAELFALAHRLAGVKDLKIGVLSKSERGYALTDGDEPSSFNADPISLKPNLPAAEAFQTVARASIRHFRLNEPLLIANRSAETLHQTRVAMSRLRSALSLFKPMVMDERYERLKRRLRDASHRLGKARNLDVYIGRNTVPHTDEYSPPSASNPKGKVKSERGRAYEHVISMLQSKSFRHFMLDLVAWVEAGPWCTSQAPEKQTALGQTIEDFAGRILKRRRRKLKRSGRHLDRLSSEERHRIRIEAKKLRYASEVFSGLSADRKHRKQYKAFIAALEDLEACLGDLNDIQAGDEIMAGLKRRKASSANGSDTVRAAADPLDERDKRSAALLSSACEAHRRFSSTKPFWKS
jgi:triphosphatase